MNKIYHLEITRYDYEELEYVVLETGVVSSALIPTICYSNGLYKVGQVLHAVKGEHEITNWAILKDAVGYLHNIEVFVGEK